MTSPLYERGMSQIRAACARLPQVVEEPAWVGVRWRIRKRPFVHVLEIREGWPPAYAKVVNAAHTGAPVVVMTFRSPLAELQVHSFATAPFFRPGWWPNIAGLVLDDRTDWDEARALVVDSYRTLAPRKLVAQIDSMQPE